MEGMGMEMEMDLRTSPRLRGHNACASLGGQLETVILPLVA